MVGYVDFWNYLDVVCGCIGDDFVDLVLGVEFVVWVWCVGGWIVVVVVGRNVVIVDFG